MGYDSVLNVKVLGGAFNQEKALVGAFSLIVKTIGNVKPVDRLQLYSGVGVLGIFLIRLRAARPRSLLVMYHATLHNLIFFIPRKMSIEHELNYILLFFFCEYFFPQRVV